MRIGSRVYVPGLSKTDRESVELAESVAVAKGHHWMEKGGDWWYHANEGDISLMTRKCCTCHRRVVVYGDGTITGSALVFNCRESRYGLAERMMREGVFPANSLYKGRRAR